jgi:zinc protease
MPVERRSPLHLERTTLPNGTELVTQPAPPTAASFAVSYLAPAGWAYDPPHREGLSLLVSEVSVSGAGRRGRAEVARMLDRYGATLTSQCHPECSELTLWGPQAHWETLLPLLTDAILTPTFDPREIGRVQRQMLERQLRETTQPDRRAEKVLLQRIFPSGHPYRETGLGTERTVRRLKRADLLRFHRDRQHAGPGVVAVTGLPPDGSFERAWRRLITLEARPSNPAPPIPREGRYPKAVERIEVPGGSQVEIRLGGPAIARNHPLYPAAFLANEVLGGRATLSRMFQELRERRGLVYNAGSEVEAMTWGGYWMAEAGTEPKNVDRVESILRRLLRTMTEREVPAPELERIRTSAIGSLALELESTSDAHELAIDVAYHHLPTDFYEAWAGALRSLTARDVRDAARAVFDPDRSATVIAGALTPARRPGDAADPA